MGTCTSHCSNRGRIIPDIEASKRSKYIDKALTQQKSAIRSKIKLLLLGTADSGKSTFLKQMKVIHKDGFGKAEITRYINILRENCLQSMQKIMNCGQLVLPHKLEKHRNAVLEVNNSDELVNCCQDIKILWNHHKVKEAFLRRGEYAIQIPCTSDYYFENVERFAQENFLPSQEDILRAKLKTTGICEVVFDMNDTEFTVVDVGGQRSERRKWIHCFDDVTAVIFLAALDEYDMKLDEDGNVNRIEDSLQLFRDITESTALKPSSWMLFLNKSDVFESKIKKLPLSNYFPDVSNEMNYEESCNYIQTLYENNFKGNKLYPFITCGLDTNNCKKVFSVVRDTVVSNFVNSVF